MMLEEYDVVGLRVKIDDVPLPAGAMGTVLMVFPGDETTYLVEFSNELGKSLGEFFLKENDLIPQTDATGRNIGQV
jgi:hypothetical protein